MRRPIDNHRFPEWQPFVDAVQQRRPDAGTWCEAWTVRDIVIHQAGNAEELARVLGAHLAGEPVGTRGFEEREGPLRAINDADLWEALLDRMATLNEVGVAADAVPADTDVAWTGRTMKVPWFAEHMREELVLHGWDITGDDAAAQARLAEPWMTTHSVFAVGRPLLAKGAKGLGPGERIEARLRVTGTDDVFVGADANHTTIGLADPEGPATLETDAAARVLLLWGRRPGDPSRICSRVGAETLGRVRRLLSGY
jgi:Mycothiol maleylpyruvate isomerase N-terminal domain